MPTVAKPETSSRGRALRRHLLAAAILASLIALEVALRTLGFPRFDACQPNDTAPWQADAEAFNVLQPNATIGVGRTNRLGLRGPELAEERSPGVPRILIVGDSTCWGVGVELERIFVVRAAEATARSIGSGVEIVNGCVPGHSSFQSRVMLARLLRFSPDAVIFYVGARNDVDRHRYFRDAEIPERLARGRAAWHGIRVLQAVEATFDGLYKKLLRKPLSYERRARVPPVDFRENVLAMLSQAEAADARSVVILPPWSTSLIERYPTIPLYQRILEEATQSSGSILVPLQPAFQSQPEAAVYQDDRFHFSAQGHAIAARELAAALVSMLDEKWGLQEWSGFRLPEDRG